MFFVGLRLRSDPDAVLKRNGGRQADVAKLDAKKRGAKYR
jgi:hypothetical protein